MFSITQLPLHRLLPMMDPTPPSRPQQPRASSSSTLPTTFPILAITTLGILTTAVLLLSYYIFVIKCCSHGTSGSLLRRLLSSVHYSRRRTGHHHIPPVNHTFPEAETRGLEPAVIRSIPVVKFSAAGAQRRPSFHECAVCLSEFEEEERIKILPSCSHPFHIDCIDTWLQFNAKCPLCRSEVMMSWANHIVVLSPRCEQGESTVVAVTDEVTVPTPVAATSPSRKKARKLHLHKAGSVGDECIDVRVGKEEDYEQFRVQPVRRSISMDSSNDRQLYLSVQEILRQNERQFQEMGGSGEGCSTASAAGGGGRVRRPFFSFSWSARSPVLPVKNDVA